MFDQGVVGLEPLGAVSAGEGQLVVSLLAVAHDVFRAYFSNSTVGTKVDPVLENIFLVTIQNSDKSTYLRISTEGSVVPDRDVNSVVRH